MMASANHPLPATSQLKATLTNNPQDSTKIPSLFQTFGQNDVSSGDDDCVEALEVRPEDDYAAEGSYGHPSGSGAAAVTTSFAGRGAGGGAAPNRGSAAAYSAAAPMSASRTTATASLNASRNRHPLSRSTHNPYALLSSTDGVAWNGPEPIVSFPTAANSAVGPQSHRYSFSNSTSQNPLTFEFNASMNNGSDVNANSNSPSSNMMAGVGHRRQPSQLLHSLQSLHGGQQQHQQMNETADGCWRDGNPKSTFSTDVRSVTTTTVGTLSTGTTGELQSITVNLRQRVRTSAGSRASSPSTSFMTMPVVPPVPPSAVAGAAATAGTLPPRPGSTSLPDDSSPLLAASSTVGNGPLNATSSNTNNRSRMINAPSLTTVVSVDADERLNPHATGVYHSELPYQQQQQEKYKHFQPHPLPTFQQQQVYYSYGGQSTASLHPPCAHNPTGYSDQSYPGMSHHPSPYSLTKVIPYPAQVPLQQADTQQQQQQRTAMMQNAAYMNPYGQMVSNPNYYMGSGGVSVPPIMPNYGRPAGMRGGMHPCGHGMPPAIYGDDCSRRGRRSQQQQHPQQSNSTTACSAVAVTVSDVTVPSPAPQLNTSNRSKSTKDKTQDKQAGGKKSSAQQDGKATTTSGEHTDSNTTASSSTAGGSTRSKKEVKKQDVARFHANRKAPIQLFVVVKRKIGGQRYACPLSEAEVPVGSQMLVEGDRGADLGEVLAHVSMEQMARDYALVERRRKASLEKLQEQRLSSTAVATTTTMVKAEAKEVDEANLPQLTGQAARDYVLSVRDWPWLIGPATPEDIASLGPQREAEKQALATAKPIVQQFIENHYQQRVARNEQVLRATTEDESVRQDVSDNDGERRASLTPLTAEELQTLELSRQVTLVDCEFQFTREKITLFVSRPSRSIFVDFRRMQRKLYRTFRCRIWIAYMDEIADDEDAPESFVFVPPPSSSLVVTASVASAVENGTQENI